MTIAAVEAAWDAAIWQHASVVAITERILKYEHTAESETEFNELCHDGEINFFECVTTDDLAFDSIGAGKLSNTTYTVEVRYTLQEVPGANSWTDVRDTIGIVKRLVKTELGDNWSGVVDFYRPILETLVISRDAINDTPVWRAVVRFQAQATETIS